MRSRAGIARNCFLSGILPERTRPKGIAHSHSVTGNMAEGGLRFGICTPDRRPHSSMIVVISYLFGNYRYDRSHKLKQNTSIPTYQATPKGIGKAIWNEACHTLTTRMGSVYQVSS